MELEHLCFRHAYRSIRRRLEFSTGFRDLILAGRSMKAALRTLKTDRGLPVHPWSLACLDTRYPDLCFRPRGLVEKGLSYGRSWPGAVGFGFLARLRGGQRAVRRRDCPGRAGAGARCRASGGPKENGPQRDQPHPVWRPPRPHDAFGRRLHVEPSFDGRRGRAPARRRL